MGGYQVLEWALMEPGRIGRLFLLCTGAAESAWGIAVHTSQRLAIEADGSWEEPRKDAGAKGLKAARAIGMLTYRNYQTFMAAQSDPDNGKPTTSGLPPISFTRATSSSAASTPRATGC